MKVRDILETKGFDVVTIRNDESLFRALVVLATNKVGSLLVLDSEKNIVGIVAPRDLLMEVQKGGEELAKTPVEKVMTRDLIIGTPDDDLEYVQAIMTENRIRHLPILDGERLTGIVSIGDVVKAHLKEIHAENRYLRDYMISKYPG